MGSSQRLPMGIRDNINDYGIVYSPNKYWETKGIKERNRLCKNRAQMANDKGIEKTFKPTPLLLVV